MTMCTFTDSNINENLMLPDLEFYNYVKDIFRNFVFIFNERDGRRNFFDNS